MGQSDPSIQGGGASTGPDPGAALGSFVTQGALSGLGGLMTYGIQKKLMAKQFEYNEQAANESRAWSERMSNTAYQRQVEDMRKAGINPMVAAMKGGGASTPAAAQGSASGAAAPQFDFQGAAKSGAEFGLAAAKLKNEAKVNDQTRANMEADRQIKLEQANTQAKQTEHLQKQIDLLQQDLDFYPHKKNLAYSQNLLNLTNASATELGFPEKQAQAELYRSILALVQHITGGQGGPGAVKQIVDQVKENAGGAFKPTDWSKPSGFRLLFPDFSRRVTEGIRAGREGVSRAFERGMGNVFGGANSARSLENLSEGGP